MNNLVLQKLLHAHQLVKMDTFTPEMHNQKLDTTEARILEKLFVAPSYYTGLQNTINPNSKDTQTIPAHVTKSVLKGFAQSVSTAAKFYIDLRNTEFLTKQEYDAIESEIKVYAPYANTFLQVEDNDWVYNILIYDRGDKTQDTGEDILHMCMCPYDKTADAFIFDFNGYSFTYHDDTSFTFWLLDSPLSKYVDTSCDSTGRYINEELNTFVNTLSANFITLMILLQYPQISEVKNVKGRKNIFLDMVTKYKATTLRAKPNFEHKQLVINMYGAKSSVSNTTNSRSIGTAFHSVRKHLRKLTNGKHTFVKAHFRGAKEHGVISKDYVINTNSL